MRVRVLFVMGLLASAVDAPFLLPGFTNHVMQGRDIGIIS